MCFLEGFRLGFPTNKNFKNYFREINSATINCGKKLVELFVFFAQTFFFFSPEIVAFFSLFLHFFAKQIIAFAKENLFSHFLRANEMRNNAKFSRND